MHTNDRKNKTLYVDTVAEMLALTGVPDGTRVDTARYSTSHTVGDGSGGEYVYDADNTATIDGGFVMPGVGGSLSFSGTTFNGTAGTGRWLLKDTTWARVDQFGAVGNDPGTGLGTSDSNAFLRAFQHHQVAMSKKRYRATVSKTLTSGLTLHGNNAIIVPENANEFAITLIATAQENPITVKELQFDGIDKSRHGLQVSVTTRFNADNLQFQDCGIGLCNNGSIDSRYHNILTNRCYVGVLVTMRTVASGLTIDDIAGQTVTLAESPYTGQAGEHLFSGLNLFNGTIGMLYEEPGNIYQTGCNILCLKPVVQLCNIGFWVNTKSDLRGGMPFVIDSCWFEANAADVATYDGVTEAGSDIAVTRGSVEVRASLIYGVVARNKSRVRLENCEGTSEGVTLIKDATASVSAGVFHGDNITIPFPCDVPVAATTGNRSAASVIPDFSSKVYTGAGLYSKTNTSADRMATFGASPILGDFTGGMTEATSVLAGIQQSPIKNLRATFSTVDGRFYGAIFSMRAHDNQQTVTIDDATDILAATAHGFLNGQEVHCSATTYPSEIIAPTAATISAATNQLSSVGHAFSNGDLVRLSGDLPPEVDAETTYVVADAASGVFALETTAAVDLVFSLDATVTVTPVYHVINSNANDFQLSKALGGAAINFSSAGADVTVKQVEKFNVLVKNQDAGAFQSNRKIVVTSDWRTYAVSGYADGSGNPHMLWTVPSEDQTGVVREVCMANVQVREFENVAEWEKYLKSKAYSY